MKPEYYVFLFIVLSGFIIKRLMVWVRQSPPTPNPWDEDSDALVNQPDAIPLCHHCLAPITSETYFCPHCDGNVGLYNNLSPYLYIFSLGEVLRQGTSGRIQNHPMFVWGYVLLSMAQYMVFAPIYWYFLFKNLHRQEGEQGIR